MLDATKVVWMPTSSAANSRGKMKRRAAEGAPELGGKAPPMPPGMKRPELEGDGYFIVDEKGALVPEMDRILSIIKEHNLVLASGHTSPREIFALFEAAKEIGIDKMVATHAGNYDVVDDALSLEQQVELGKMGVFIEHCALEVLPGQFDHDQAVMAKAIKAIGAEHCIISGDLGPKVGSPLPVEGMKTFISMLMDNGITPEEIELMFKVNPAKLLDLD
jgi:hypothetical protein